MDESAQKVYRDSNCYILAPRCGPSTVAGGRNGPYPITSSLRDMMTMTMMMIGSVSCFKVGLLKIDFSKYLKRSFGLSDFKQLSVFSHFMLY